LTFVLEPGQEQYVRLKVQMGVFAGRVASELVDEHEAEAS
jgi:hypothetical protein